MRTPYVLLAGALALGTAMLPAHAGDIVLSIGVSPYGHVSSAGYWHWNGYRHVWIETHDRHGDHGYRYRSHESDHHHYYSAPKYRSYHGGHGRSHKSYKRYNPCG